MRSSFAGLLAVSPIGTHFLWCEPTLLNEAYLWHVCKGPVRRSMVGSSTAHLWRTKKHADDKNKTILMRQSHARFATAGWNRRCRLSFYGSGKGASVGERPTREHFLAVNGEKLSLHSTARLRSLPWRCIASCSNLSKDSLTCADSSEVRSCTH